MGNGKLISLFIITLFPGVPGQDTTTCLTYEPLEQAQLKMVMSSAPGPLQACRNWKVFESVVTCIPGLSRIVWKAPVCTTTWPGVPTV
ncbi:hypothetical protein Y1Q_0013027 [Alligator mississippiensis]|uniref:Uncharacterized protein n=1 Tax=Alligator mississippiensis TaxID=8496 RepID=A0A151MTJ0_ALLMI|nr:hypothetical protein Y1Q_0013027 [Alligator mississippiensis]